MGPFIVSMGEKLLSYFNINIKYLNRLYTVLAIIPLIYHLKLLSDFYEYDNKTKFITFLILFIFFLYIWIINFLFYFFDKNTIFDITQWIAKVVPDDVFNVPGAELLEIKLPENIVLERIRIHDYIHLTDTINKLIEHKEIAVNSGMTDGYLIPHNTLLPYYDFKRLNEKLIEVNISSELNYDSMKKVGIVDCDNMDDIMGVFVYGGQMKKDGIVYNDRYILKLAIKKAKKEVT